MHSVTTDTRFLQLLDTVPPLKKRKLNTGGFVQNKGFTLVANTSRRRKKKRKSKSLRKTQLDYVSVPPEYPKWDKQRQNAWKSIGTDPNNYYLNYLPPQEAQTPWTAADILKLKHILKNNNVPKHNEWGLFSFKFKGKTGKQIQEQLDKLMQSIATQSLQFNQYQARKPRDDDTLPYFIHSGGLNSNSIVFLAPQEVRKNKYLFIHFKHTDRSKRIANTNAIQLSECTPIIRNTINSECQSLYETFQNDIHQLVSVNATSKQRISFAARRRLRQKHEMEANKLFWRHAFLMAADADTTNVAVP
eukprot:251396_1